MTRNLVRLQNRFLERLFRLLGISQRPAPAWAPIESLEQRTLMSITALNSAVHAATGLFDQDAPRIAADAAGEYVVVWSTGGAAGGGSGNDGQLNFSLYDNTDTAIVSNVAVTSTLARGVPAGSAGSTVITSLDHPSYSVAMNSSGSFVIAWEDDNDVLAQRYDATGTPIGSAINVTQGDAVVQTAPSVAMDPAGDFAVSWLADQYVTVNTKTMTPKYYYDYVDSSTNTVKRMTTNAATDVSNNSFTTSTVKARRFDATGSGGSIITVSPTAVVTSGTGPSSTFLTNLNPSIAMDSAGDFAVAWDANTYVPKKVLGTAASKTTGQGTTYDVHNNPHTVTLHYYTGPQFYYNMGLSGAKLMIQRYNAAGTTHGTAITALSKASSTTAGTLVAEDASLAMDNAGDFAVSGAVQYVKSHVHTDSGTGYTSNYYATSSALSIKRFSASGAAVAEIKVASAAFTPFFSASPAETPQITDASIAMDSTGNMMVAWDQAAYDSGVNDVASTGVFARRYSPTGSAQETAPFQIGVGTVTGTVFPAITFSGGLIDLAYNNNQELFAQTFRPVLPASKLVFSMQPSTVAAGALGEIDVQVLDANGFVATSGSSTVALSIFSGTKGAKLVGTASVHTVNGVAVFTGLSLLRGGIYVLKATDGKFTSATSSSFGIITAPTHLAFTTVPKSVTAGIDPTVVVTVEDANGDPAVGDGSTVTLSVATGSILGTVSAVAINGKATFNGFIFPNVGTYSLLAQDGALASAASSNITVTPAHAALFSFDTASVNTTAGTKFTMQITATDIFGNLATLDHTKVTLSLVGAPTNSKITGSSTIALNKGHAKFSNISIAAAGTYSLVAAGGPTSATSNSFIVAPAAAAKLVYATPPTTTIAGQPVSAVVVDVVDSFGNRIFTNNSGVTLTIVSAPKGSATPTGTFTQIAGAGEATFGDLTFTTQGTYKIKVAQGVLNATSGNFAIQPDVPSQVLFIKGPTSVTAGTAEGTITAAVEDQFGNIETTSSAVVTIAINSGPDGAVLLGTATASAVKGIATFNKLALHTAGTYTLSASTGTLSADISGSIVIAPGSAKALQLATPPADVITGQTMSSPITVNVLDAFGNIAAGDHSTVKLTVHTGPVGFALPSNASASAVAGVASFPNFTLTTTGGYTLTVTDGSLPSIISDPFSVDAVPVG